MKSILTGKKSKKTQKGITLIALVVTIIVLLILAGVSIMMLTGQNGILRRAEEAGTSTAHSEVYEILNLQTADYMTESKLGEYSGSLVDYLISKGYIEETVEEGKYLIKVEALLGQKGKYGNGTGDIDVYKLEEVTSPSTGKIEKVATKEVVKISATETSKTYNVVYYGKSGSTPIELGKISDGNAENIKALTKQILSSKEFMLIDLSSESSVTNNDRMKDKIIMALCPEILSELGISEEKFLSYAFGFDSLQEIKNADSNQDEENDYEDMISIINMTQSSKGLEKLIGYVEAIVYSEKQSNNTYFKLTAPDNIDYVLYEENLPSIFSINSSGKYKFTLKMKEDRYAATYNVDQYEIINTLKEQEDGAEIYDFKNDEYLEISSGKIIVDGNEIDIPNEKIKIANGHSIVEMTDFIDDAKSGDFFDAKLTCTNGEVIEGKVLYLGNTEIK